MIRKFTLSQGDKREKRTEHFLLFFSLFLKETIPLVNKHLMTWTGIKCHAKWNGIWILAFIVFKCFNLRYHSIIPKTRKSNFNWLKIIIKFLFDWERLKNHYFFWVQCTLIHFILFYVGLITICELEREKNKRERLKRRTVKEEGVHWIQVWLSFISLVFVGFLFHLGFGVFVM